MAKNVVIVESPAKGRTISGYLGKDFEVCASKGHVRDLPPNEFGVDTENDFEPKYRLLPGRKKIIDELKSKVKKAETVYLATDSDREGEAIAWHLANALKLGEDRVRRVVYHEITRKAVQEAFEEPGDIDMDLVNAQQARRILDRIVGYKLSPLISRKITSKLSAGRVQSVAVRLVVEREREIEAFEPEEYWKITAKLQSEEEKQEFEALLKKIEEEEVAISNEQQATSLIERLENATWTVTDIKKRRSQSKASPPFITSTMQQTASTRLRWSGQRTMRIAQQLYEGIDIGSESVGLITYMRTDSTKVADSAITTGREVIETSYGPEYLPKKPNTFKNPAGAQAAHEAIRPTDPARKPDDIAQFLSTDQLKLYRLIWERFIASQMKPAVYNLTDVEITAGVGVFVARGRVMVFDGWTRVAGQPDSGKDKDDLLPKLEQGQVLELLELIPSQHFTQPPPRYSEASLIRALEREGIGRPSTYATIVSTIQKRNYVKQKQRAFHATPLGCEVTDQLVEHFPEEMDVKFTSHLEQDLDRIEEGKKDWHEVLKAFHKRFSRDLEKAKKEMKKSKTLREDEPKKCPECDGDLVPRFSREGDRFLGCTNYPDCTYTLATDSDRPEDVETEHKCPKCGAPLLIKKGRRGREFLACSAYPNCKCTMGIDKEGNPVPFTEPEATGEKCEKCGSEMVIKTGRRGKFIACSGFPKCRNTKPLKGEEKGKGEKKGERPARPKPVETDIKCESCGAPMLVRSSRYGKFLGCSTYPKCKTTMKLPPDFEMPEKEGAETQAS